MGVSAWKCPWQATLLAASILSSCFLLSQGQADTLTITAEPAMPRQGETVTLKPGMIPNKTISCNWFRGENNAPNLILTTYVSASGDSKGPAFTGRDIGGSGCSLQITDLQPNYSGTYTLTIDGPGIRAVGNTTIKVVASIVSSCFLLSQGQVETIPVTAEPATARQGETATLKPGTIPDNSISCRWYRGGNNGPNLIINTFGSVPGDIKGPAYTGRETVGSGCSLQITNLNTNDSGTYTLKIDGFGIRATGCLEFQVIDPPLSGYGGWAGGAIAVIILACLAGMLALTGTLFCFFRRHRRRHQREKDDLPPATVYENIPSSRQDRTGANPGSSSGTSNTYEANPGSSSGTNNTYETLKCKDTAVYQEISMKPTGLVSTCKE